MTDWSAWVILLCVGAAVVDCLIKLRDPTRPRSRVILNVGFIALVVALVGLTSPWNSTLPVWIWWILSSALGVCMFLAVHRLLPAQGSRDQDVSHALRSHAITSATKTPAR